jgi:hypothetical protein
MVMVKPRLKMWLVVIFSLGIKARLLPDTVIEITTRYAN